MTFLLAILVAVVQVAGPWLCCCGLPQLLAQRESSCCAAPVPPPTAEPECPMCKGTQGKKSGCSQPEPTKQSHDQGFPDPCPMGGKSFMALPAATLDSGHLSQNDLLPDSSSVLTVAEWLPLFTARDVLGDENLSELPFLPTRTRLYSHHALRC